MKKFAAFCMMILALGFVTIGCGDKAAAPATPAATDTTTTPAATDTAAPAGEAAPVTE